MAKQGVFLIIGGALYVLTLILGFLANRGIFMTNRYLLMVLGAVGSIFLIIWKFSSKKEAEPEPQPVSDEDDDEDDEYP